MTRLTFVSALLAPAALMSMAVSAQAESVAFRFSDLDLATEAGRAELDRRIEAATRKACPDETVTGSRIAIRQGRAECMADVHRQIMARVQSRSASTRSSR